MISGSEVKQMHFLVVDDDGDSRATIVEYLHGLGATRITQARDGGEALRLLDKDPSINFIISDWDMPMVNGLTLLQRVKASPVRAKLPFLIVTSPISQEAEKVIMAAENLVDGYIIKPFRSAILKEKIDAILSEPIRGPQRQVVVVDDDFDSRETIVDYLRKMGFKDIAAMANGQEALEYISKNAKKIGLIISDWEMPEMNGIDLLRSCKANQALSETPFLMVTSQTSIERMKVLQAAKAQVDQYLLKPFTASEIQTRIETVLTKARTKDEVENLVAEALDHQSHGRWQKAQTRFEEAIALDPTHDTALRGMGEVLTKLKTVHDALPYFKRAVEANGNNPKSYLRLASAYESLGWWEKAIALLQGALQQISFNSELHFALGKLYQRRSMIDAAKSEFEKTLEIQLDHQEARLMLEMIANGRKSQ
jgi:two-component system chemotaxis response regulator CheY